MFLYGSYLVPVPGADHGLIIIRIPACKARLWHRLKRWGISTAPPVPVKLRDTASGPAFLKSNL